MYGWGRTRRPRKQQGSGGRSGRRAYEGVLRLLSKGLLLRVRLRTLKRRTSCSVLHAFMMTVHETSLPGVLRLQHRRYRDQRGYFEELWRREWAAETGLPATFVQDNLSCSSRHVLRGLHYQYPKGQGKLITVLEGAVFDVVVDLRRGAPSFGQWLGCRLSAEEGMQLYVPPGRAHGFVVLSDRALFHYKCTSYYAPDCERSLRWDDPDLDIAWPVEDPILSQKDARAPRLPEIDPRHLPGG